MGMNSFANKSQNPQCFTVLNVSPEPKTLSIFTYPINWMTTRNLLLIPGVAESDIRASLLKGTLNTKIKAKEIIVTCSDIDLLQFNTTQKAFLEAAGITNGLSIGTGQLTDIQQQDIFLIGATDGINQVFYVPNAPFLIDTDHTILVYRNGVRQDPNDDYSIFESAGPSTGYDGVFFLTPPEAGADITADYWIVNS
jgi:hypothetical protein